MSEKKAAPAKPAAGKLSLPRRAEKGAVYGPSGYRDEPASEMRRTIARRLVTSLGPIPHFFLTSEIDMERAAETRRSINELYPDVKLSINDLVIKVAAVSLIQHPQVNASFQDKTIRYYEQIDLLPTARRVNGRRQYDASILERLAFIQVTQNLGFTLAEIQRLFHHQEAAASLPDLWQLLARQKLADVNRLIQHAQSVQQLLLDGLRKQVIDQLHCGVGLL